MQNGVSSAVVAAADERAPAKHTVQRKNSKQFPPLCVVSGFKSKYLSQDFSSLLLTQHVVLHVGQWSDGAVRL